jgi:hypothetical protein
MADADPEASCRSSQGLSEAEEIARSRQLWLSKCPQRRLGAA